MAGFHWIILDCPVAEPQKAAITVSGKASIGVLRVRHNQHTEHKIHIDSKQVTRIHCAVMSSATQLYFWHTDSTQKSRLGLFDLATNELQVKASLDLAIKGEASSFALGSLRCTKRHIFLVVGRPNLVHTNELHAYDLVDQYWEKL